MKKLLSIAAVLFGIVNLYGQKAPKTDYVGVYKLTGAPFEKMIVTLENGLLMVEAEGVGKSDLKDTETSDEFNEPNNSATIVFRRNSTKIVDGVIIKVQGMELLGEKEGNTENAYVGKYAFEEGSPIAEVNVVLKEGKLFGESEQGSAELKPTSNPEEFEIVGYGGTAIFTKDTAGKVTNMVMNVQGTSMKASKK